MYVFIYSLFCSIEIKSFGLEAVTSLSLDGFKLERQQLFPSA